MAVVVNATIYTGKYINDDTNDSIFICLGDMIVFEWTKPLVNQ